MYVTPKEAIKYYKVSEQALRSWANTGKIQYYTTKGGHRRYLLPTENTTNELGDVTGEAEQHRKKIIYARVSSQKQKGDLGRQIEFLKTKYPDYQVISDIGSGINFDRKGFKNILDGVFKGTISEVVVTHRDRFTRFGFELFEWIFQQHNSQLLSDQTDNKNAQEELSEDLLSIITVFTARYYGKRKYKILSENPNIST